DIPGHGTTLFGQRGRIADSGPVAVKHTDRGGDFPSLLIEPRTHADAVAGVDGGREAISRRAEISVPGARGTHRTRQAVPKRGGAGEPTQITTIANADTRDEHRQPRRSWLRTAAADDKQQRARSRQDGGCDGSSSSPVHISATVILHPHRIYA